MSKVAVENAQMLRKIAIRTLRAAANARPALRASVLVKIANDLAKSLEVADAIDSGQLADLDAESESSS